MKHRVLIQGISFFILTWIFINNAYSQSINWSMKANPLNLTINGLAFRADGQKVLSGTNCHPASIRIFDVTSSNLNWDYNVGMTYMCIMGVTFSSNANYIAAIEEFGNIFLFDNTGPSPVIMDTINTGTSYGFATAISPDNSKVAVGCSNGKLKIYSLPGGSLFNDVNAHPSWVTTIAYSPDGQKIVTGGNDDKVKIWSNSGTLLVTCTGHSGDITCVKVTPDNNSVISSSKDGKIKIWNINTGALINTLSGHKLAVNGVDISPDGSKIVSASSDSTCKLWNLSTGGLITTFSVVDSGAYTAVAWSPKGNKIATGNQLSDLVMWNLPATIDTRENAISNSFKLSPNPAKDQLHISLSFEPKNAQWMVYNTLGQLQKTYSNLNSKSSLLDISELKEGHYYGVLMSDSQRITANFYKIK